MASQLKLPIIVAIFFALPIVAFSQNESETFTARNAIFFEGGGNAGRFAISYGRIFHQKERFKLSGSVGFFMWPDKIDSSPTSTNSTSWLPWVPLEISGFWGKSKHHLEIGAGITPYLESIIQLDPNSLEVSEKITFASLIPIRIGYRYQKPEGGIFFRVGYTPFLALYFGETGSSQFYPIFAGISLGKSF